MSKIFIGAEVGRGWIVGQLKVVGPGEVWPWGLTLPSIAEDERRARPAELESKRVHRVAAIGRTSALRTGVAHPHLAVTTKRH